MPLLEKDVIKESLAEAIGAADREASQRLGTASYRVLYDLAFGMLERGVGVMIEANLDRRFALAELQRLSGVSRVRLVQCVAEQTVIERRYRDRHAQGERHAAHFDLEALPEVLTGLDRGEYDLTMLGFETITVRTDDGYRPEYHELVSRLT